MIHPTPHNISSDTFRLFNAMMMIIENNINILILPNTAEHSTGPHPNASFTAGAKAVSILQTTEQNEKDERRKASKGVRDC